MHYATILDWHSRDEPVPFRRCHVQPAATGALAGDDGGTRPDGEWGLVPVRAAMSAGGCHAGPHRAGRPALVPGTESGHGPRGAGRPTLPTGAERSPRAVL